MAVVIQLATLSVATECPVASGEESIQASKKPYEEGDEQAQHEGKERLVQNRGDDPQPDPHLLANGLLIFVGVPWLQPRPRGGVAGRTTYQHRHNVRALLALVPRGVAEAPRAERPESRRTPAGDERGLALLIWVIG